MLWKIRSTWEDAFSHVKHLQCFCIFLYSVNVCSPRIFSPEHQIMIKDFKRNLTEWLKSYRGRKLLKVSHGIVEACVCPCAWPWQAWDVCARLRAGKGHKMCVAAEAGSIMPNANTGHVCSTLFSFLICITMSNSAVCIVTLFR